MDQRQQPVFRASYQTLDNTVAGQNASYLYFRRFLGPRDSSGGQFFSLEPAVTTDPSIRINLHNSTGSIISTGYLYDTVINPPASSYNPDALFSTVTITGNGTPQSTLNVTTASSYFGLVDPGAGGPLALKYLNDAADATGPTVNLCKSRGGGATSLVGDSLGEISFYGANSTPTYSLGASIAAIQAGTALAGVPAALAFATTDLTGATAERARIDASGNVGIGTSTPYVRLQTVVNQKTALDGIAAVSADVNTIIGAYTEVTGPYTGLNVGSIQATSGSGAFNDYKLALNPRGGDVYMGDGSIICHLYGNLDVSGTGYITGNFDVGTAGLVHADTGVNRVGIMQPAPAYTLDVSGTGYITGNFDVGTAGLVHADTGVNRVGIMQPAPAYTLDVSGDINVGPGGNYYLNGVPLSTAAPPQLFYASFTSSPTFAPSPSASSLFNIPPSLTSILTAATSGSTGDLLIRFSGYAVPSGAVLVANTFTYSISYNTYAVTVTPSKQSTIPILPTGIQQIYPVDMQLLIPLANFAGYNTNIGLTITATSASVTWTFVLTDAVIVNYYPAGIPFI